MAGILKAKRKEPPGGMDSPVILRICLPLLFVIALSLLAASCSRTVRISNTDFLNDDPANRTEYVVTTSDDLVIRFTCYSISNDTLIIYDRPLQPESAPLLGRQGAKAILPFDDIKLIDRVEPSPEKYLVVTTLILLPFVFYFYILPKGFDFGD